MNLKILAIIIGILVVGSVLIGCSKDDTPDNPDIPDTPNNPIPVEPVEDGPGEYIMGFGDIIVVNGKKIKFMDLDEDGEITLIVDGQRKIVYGTSNPYIVGGGVEVEAKRTDFKPNPDDTTITLVVRLVNIREGEYLLYVNNPITVKGKTLTLVNVKSNDFITLNIGDKVGTFDIPRRDTKEVGGLKITNTEPVHRPVRGESYAILTIV